MSMIVKNGQIHPIPTKNGQISTLIPYLPKDVVAPTGYGNAVMGVTSGNISTVMGVATANISKVNGV